MQEFNGMEFRCYPKIYNTCLLFAGAETNEFRSILRMIGIRNVLLSFYYLRKLIRKKSIEQLKEEFLRDFDFVFIDSGGYTLNIDLEKSGGAKGKSLDIEQYYNEYLDFAFKMRESVQAFAELDFTSEDFGKAERVKWLNKAKDMGIHLIPVLQGESNKEIEDLGWFDAYDYIGTGSGWVRSDLTLHRYFRFARKKKILLHGFGLSSEKDIVRRPFFTVDSTSWISGGRFGAIFFSSHGRMENFEIIADTRKKSDILRKKFKSKIEKKYKEEIEETIGDKFDWEGFKNGLARPCNIINAFMWKKWTDWYKYQCKNAYWLSPEDIKEAKKLGNKGVKASMKRDNEIVEVKSEVIEKKPKVPVLDERIVEKISCNTCYLDENCPRYKEGSLCGYDFTFKIEGSSDLLNLVKTVIEIEAQRTFHAVHIEKSDGGVLDPNVTDQLRTLMDMAQTLKNMGDNRDEVFIRAKGKGILREIFGK